jgi:hypothetical protein
MMRPRLGRQVHTNKNSSRAQEEFWQNPVTT